MAYFRYLLIALMATLVNVPPSSAFVVSRTGASSHLLSRSSSSSPREQAQIIILSERRWNFNDGQSPWGMKKNAEVWNGRVAQMAFVVIFLQELIQGKGVIQSVQEGNALNVAALGVTAATVVGLAAFLAIQGDDDYTKKDPANL